MGYDPDKKKIVVRAENYYDQNGKKTAGYEELLEYIRKRKIASTFSKSSDVR